MDGRVWPMSVLCSTSRVGWLEGLLSAVFLSLSFCNLHFVFLYFAMYDLFPAPAISSMFPFSIAISFKSDSLHKAATRTPKLLLEAQKPHSMNFDTGNTKPAKQTRQMVMRY